MVVVGGSEGMAYSGLAQLRRVPYFGKTECTLPPCSQVRELPTRISAGRKTCLLLWRVHDQPERSEVLVNTRVEVFCGSSDLCFGSYVCLGCLLQGTAVLHPEAFRQAPYPHRVDISLPDLFPSGDACGSGARETISHSARWRSVELCVCAGTACNARGIRFGH